MIQRVALRFTTRSPVWFALLALVGCQGLGGRALVPYDAAAGLFDEATIHYEIDAGSEGMPISVTRIDGQLVSYEPLPSEPLPRRTLGVLDIRYPHPARGANWALATVRIQSRFHAPASNDADRTTAAASEQTVEETWQLDITRDELTSLVAALSASGYFQNERPSSAADVEIETRLDGSHVRRRWRHVPALDGVIRRARTAGQLIDYRRSPSLPGPTSGGFSAVAVLRALQQKGQYRLPARDALGPVQTASNTNPLFAAPSLSPEPRFASRPQTPVAQSPVGYVAGSHNNPSFDAPLDPAGGTPPTNAPAAMTVVP